MTEADDQIAEARRLSRLLVASAEQAKSGFAEAVAPFGLPVPLARALLVLSAPTPMGELAEQLGVDPSYITGLADQLEERGLVSRVPGTDRRVKVLELTPNGESAYAAVFEAVNRTMVLTRRLTPGERQTLGMLLERLLDDSRDSAK